MALAIHEGGPADGQRLRADGAPQIRYFAPAAERAATAWVPLARYVFVPPRDGPRCTYRYTGVHQVKGPVLGSEAEPDWS